MDRKNQTKKLPGFYIALCCCVIAIGAAGFFMQNEEDSQSTNALTPVDETDSPDYITSLKTDAENGSDELPVVSTPLPAAEYAPSEQDTADTQYVADASGADQNAEASFDESVTANADSDYTYDNPDLEPASVIVQAEESSEFTDPVPGMTILCGFSGSTLMYNEALGDWRTHDGVDIAADAGCSVSAAADGTVAWVGTDTYGNTVKIDHGNGLTTVYSQLGELNVAAGDTVSGGDVIGTVGESIGETVSDTHLHFEVHRDGKPQDPVEF